MLTTLILLHSVSGIAIEVNPKHITHLRNPDTSNLFVEGAKCLVNMADGKYITVKETCTEVRRLIEEQ
jgi:uncharacterized protein YlzI (FlbEa/FlbD family)